MIEGSKFKKISQKILGENSTDKEINRICRVLNSWEKIISREAFPTFEYVASIFNYYSQDKAICAFKKLDEQFKYLSQKHVLFLPLRTKDRMESSIPLFTILKESLPIDQSVTNINNSGSVLKDIYEKKTEYAKASKLIYEPGNTPLNCSLTRSIHNYNEKISKLKEEITEIEKCQNQLIENFKNKIPTQNNSLKKLSNRLKEVNRQIRSFESKKSSLLNSYKQNYVSLIQVKNVIIFDDFLCTGTSVNKFINTNIEYIRKLSDVKILFLFIESTSIGKSKVDKTITDKNLKNVEVKSSVQSINVDEKVKEESEEKFRIFKTEEEKIESEFNLYKSRYGCRTAIASFVNAPNSNCSFLSNKGNGGWLPLFERATHKKVDFDEEVLKDVVEGYS